MGLFANGPDQRMPLDVDGTICVKPERDGSVTVVPASYVNAMVSDDYRFVSWLWVTTGSNWISFIFPELRDITGCLLSLSRFENVFNTTVSSGGTLSSPTEVRVEISSDTTNGLDGNWTVTGITGPSGVMMGNRTNAGLIDDYGPNSTSNSPTMLIFGTGISSNQAVPSILPHYRNRVATVSWTNVRGIKFHYTLSGPPFSADSTTLQTHLVHLYGKPSAGQDLARLEFWHPTLNQRLTMSNTDQGDVLTSTTGTTQFRLKNTHSTLTANNVRLLLDSASRSPSLALDSQFSYTTDGTNYYSSLNFSSIAAGGYSPVITLRRQTAALADLYLWTDRMLVRVGSWT